MRASCHSRFPSCRIQAASCENPQRLTRLARLPGLKCRGTGRRPRAPADSYTVSFGILYEPANQH